eukprot:g4796.t1
MDRIAVTDSENAHKQVRKEDQLAINEFSRNNSRLEDMTFDMDSKKKLLETLSDAIEEIALADPDEGSIKLKLGESYIDVDEDTAEEHMNAQIERLQESIDASTEMVAALNKRQNELKIQLKERFGTAINLEK